MFRPGGYVQITGEDGVVLFSYDTFTCRHCNNMVEVKPKCDLADLGGMCRLCMKMICPRCTALGVCSPFEKKLDEEEARYHARRSYGV